MRPPYRCVRCGIPATDDADSIVQRGVKLTVHLPMTDDEGRTVEWCRQHGGPVRPQDDTESRSS